MASPVAAPAVCVVLVSCEVSGTISLLTLLVTCSTGPADSTVASLAPVAVTVPPTLSTTAPSGVARGASGASWPVPRPLTAVPALDTAAPSSPTTLPVLATVTPTGLETLGMLPRPPCSPAASAPTASPVLPTTPPTPLCVCAGSSGRLALPSCAPRSPTVLPALPSTEPALLMTAAAGVSAGGWPPPLLPLLSPPVPPLPPPPPPPARSVPPPRPPVPFVPALLPPPLVPEVPMEVEPLPLAQPPSASKVARSAVTANCCLRMVGSLCSRRFNRSAAQRLFSPCVRRHPCMAQRLCQRRSRARRAPRQSGGGGPQSLAEPALAGDAEEGFSAL
ncbi:hypothetical protein D3C81_1258390 [compost metagenome]